MLQEEVLRICGKLRALVIGLPDLLEGDQRDDSFLVALKEALAVADASALAEESILGKCRDGIQFTQVSPDIL